MGAQSEQARFHLATSQRKREGDKLGYRGWAKFRFDRILKCLRVSLASEAPPSRDHFLASTEREPSAIAPRR